MAAYIVKVMIENAHPPVWRRIAVPEKILYKDLHTILQIAFGWYDYHLHDFSFPGSDFRVVMSKEDMTFGDCVLEGSRLIDEDITEEKWIRYTYDFGDDWEHKITFEKMDYDYTQRYATILKWKGDNFSEDVGGVYGAEYFMTDEAKEEYGEDYMEPRQPFDLSKTNDLLARKTFPVRKNKGKASSGKRSIDLSNPAIKKEMQQFLRELMKAAMEETDFEVPEEQYLKPKKPSKNETMVNKWLDFSDRWAAALQSAGVPSKSAESQTQAFMEMQEQLSKEGRWEQMTLPGIDMPKENAEPKPGETTGKDITAGNCTIRCTTGEHTVGENLAAHSEKVLRDYCKYLRLSSEPGKKADRAAAVANAFHEHPEYLRLTCTHEQLECLLSMAGLRDSRYRIMSTDAVEIAILMGLMECFITHRKYMWHAELRFACDAKDLLSRMDGKDLADYYSKLAEKDRSVLPILSAYSFIRFEDLRKIARKYAGIRDTATDFERYLYCHLRLQDQIVTVTRNLGSEAVPYAALSGIDVQRVSDVLIHFEDNLTLKPFSNELYKKWRENNLFSIEIWKNLLMLAMDSLNIDGDSPDEIPIGFIEHCYHMVLSGCDVRELCIEFCKEIPLQYVTQHVLLWQLAIEAVSETPLPALMSHSRNEFLDMFGEKDGPEIDMFYEYLPIFPHDGIEGKIKADTHLFNLAEPEAEHLMFTLSFAQLSGEFTAFDDFIRDHGRSDELQFLKASMEADSGNPGTARKIIDGLIKSHKGPVDDLIAFRDSLPASGTTTKKRKKTGKAAADEARALLEEYLREGSNFDLDYKSDYESDYLSSYQSDYQSDNIVQIPVQRESPKIYPNDPCPCGSGKKYKKCCGKNKT